MTVVGREQEYKLLQLKVNKFLKDEVSSTIYISGVPGSGKTYTLTQVLQDLKIDCAYINSGHLKTKTEIYKKIYENIKCNKTKNKDNFLSIKNHFLKCDNPHIVVVDEVDLLVNKKQSILYNLFDLAYVENSKLLLILISNTMNLPEETFESKVCSRIGKNRIDFKPYTHAKLKKIITKKYKNKDLLDIELITRRVASVFGDIRKAFNLVNKSDKTKEINNMITDTLSPLITKILPNLSKYQKHLLYVICNTSENFSTDSIFKNFEAFCKTYEIPNIDFYEFIDTLEFLKLYGIIRYKTYIDKILLLVDTDDVNSTLKNDQDYNISTIKRKM